MTPQEAEQVERMQFKLADALEENQRLKGQQAEDEASIAMYCAQRNTARAAVGDALKEVCRLGDVETELRERVKELEGKLAKSEAHEKDLILNINSHYPLLRRMESRVDALVDALALYAPDHPLILDAWGDAE